MLKANNYHGRSMVCLADENIKEKLWHKGDSLWGEPIKYTPQIVDLEDWEDYECWLPENVTVQSFSEKATLSYDEWLENS